MFGGEKGLICFKIKTMLVRRKTKINMESPLLFSFSLSFILVQNKKMVFLLKLKPILLKMYSNQENCENASLKTEQKQRFLFQFYDAPKIIKKTTIKYRFNP